MHKTHFWIGFIAILLSTLLITSCGETDPHADIAEVNISIDFDRTDLKLKAATEAIQGGNDFVSAYQRHLKSDSAFLFYYAGVDLINEELNRREEAGVPKHLVDSVIAFKLGPLLADSAFQWLLDTLAAQFPAEDPIFRQKLFPLLKRYHLHFPDVNLPLFRTHINGYDPSGHPSTVDQFLITDQYFSLGLHYFMGKDFAFYSPNLPNYIRRRFDKSFLDITVAQQLADGTVPPIRAKEQPSLLAKMVREGIKLEVMHRLLPQSPDSMILMYSTNEMEWADYFEQNIYKDMATKLYSTNFMDHRSYMAESPFTQQVSQKSAPRLGHFIGWRIVQSYLQQNKNVDLSTLCQTSDYGRIFQQAKYKP